MTQGYYFRKQSERRGRTTGGRHVTGLTSQREHASPLHAAVTSVCRRRLHQQYDYSTFLRNEQPSVKRVLPPVGVHSRTEQLAHTTAV